MQKQHRIPILFIALILFSLLSTSTFAVTSSSNPTQEDKLTITIEIVADSLNTITASVTVVPGMNARDLMDRLFQIDYVDRGKKFIKGIAGFRTRRFKREYWALEVNGEYSKVGIAEIVLRKSTKIVWRLKSY